MVSRSSTLTNVVTIYRLVAKKPIRSKQRNMYVRRQELTNRTKTSDQLFPDCFDLISIYHSINYTYETIKEVTGDV